MKISTRLFAVLLCNLILAKLASSRQTLSYPLGDTAERTNWRKYTDC